jgi:hypothetical protein
MKREFGGRLIDLAGAIDMHCHPFPDLFPRLADDLDIAIAARDAGMKALMLKCHHESTVSRAYLIQRVVPGIHVFGGVVLNSYVGGINPAAVEAALRLGGKEVWMPTIDAGYHAEKHGGTGGYGRAAGWAWRRRDLGPGPRGQAQARGRGGARAGGAARRHPGHLHLSPREIVALVRAAQELGIQKVVVTHPFFKVPSLDLPTLEEIVRLGGMPEFGYCTISPAWQYASPDKVVQAIKMVGASRCMLASDTGQRHNPLPSEALRIFAQTLFERGIAEETSTR